ncbi:MAG: hypothetical protein ACOCWI_02915 [Bacillota bacterium]
MKKEKVFYGDIHNHCSISYGKGSFIDAIQNAKQKLDFCSITGHAHWCDMPKPNERIAHIIEFHKVGFKKLKENWDEIIKAINKQNIPEEFLLFPGFEMHSCQDGDVTVVYFEDRGEILYKKDLKELQSAIENLKQKGVKVLAIPHHIGYKVGARGINWKTFNPKVSPVVEIYSMHGCSESSQTAFPYMHSMGPLDWESLVQYGLSQGKVFGFVGSSDHHNAYPGSYGHGYMGVWAKELSSKSIYNAISNRRTFALTGDKIVIDYELDNIKMGEVSSPKMCKELKIDIEGGCAIDYTDIIINNKIIKRISSYEMMKPITKETTIKTKIHLEVGWGQRGKRQDWDVEYGISDGQIIDIEPRFRGADILSPEQNDHSENEKSAFYSSYKRINEKAVRFNTITYGNMTNTTPGTQGVCINVQMPRTAKVWARINGIYKEYLVNELLKGGKSGYLIDEIDSPSWLMHKIFQEHEYIWNIRLDKFDYNFHAGDFLYVRVKQENNQWAWGSPVFFRET